MGVENPEREIYRLAFAVTQRRPEEAFFVDDRPLNLECALDEGLRGIQFSTAEQIRNDLIDVGAIPV